MYVRMGLTTAVYIRYTTAGLSPHVLLKATIAFLMRSVILSFQFSLESRIMSRYPAELERLSSVPPIFGGLKVGIDLFLVKRTTSILEGFIFMCVLFPVCELKHFVKLNELSLFGDKLQLRKESKASG